MKSNLLKLTSVLSAVAFMVVTMFSTPAQAELVSANDVAVEANYDHSSLLVKDVYTFISGECWVYKCEVETKAPAESSNDN